MRGERCGIRRKIQLALASAFPYLFLVHLRLADLLTSLVAKITVFDLAVYFNQLLGEPLLQIKDFAC